ncbi:MAG: hypothetical protein ACO3KY_10745 [Lysobacterales bacterium]
MKNACSLFAWIAFCLPAGSIADWTEARCDIYPAGSDQLTKMIPCTFGQRQGAVTISRSDGVSHDLRPTGDAPGNYTDELGRSAYRQSGLGTLGLIFRLAEESVFVYWDTSALKPVNDPKNNATYPYSTADYDATTLLRCRRLDTGEDHTCPAGILRMEDQQASIVITGPGGETLTINFMSDYVNATTGEVQAHFEDDTWTVIVNGREQYEIPLAAIEGG